MHVQSIILSTAKEGSDVTLLFVKPRRSDTSLLSVNTFEVGRHVKAQSLNCQWWRTRERLESVRAERRAV